MQTIDLKKVAIEARGLYTLYNAFGRGKIDEFNFCIIFIHGDLGKWIKQQYTKAEIAERLRGIGLI